MYLVQNVRHDMSSIDRSDGHVKADNPLSRSMPVVPLYPRRPKLWRQALRDSVEHEFMYLRIAHTCAVGANP